MLSQLTNQLSKATSPYLRQHADNPVAWQTWNAATLSVARKSNKPILLSIGYSACHWCHVMAHESFADHDTARLLNEQFVNIKVDREERPDLDKIYQLSHTILNNGKSGGWPLTVFLSPKNHIPFFCGTYFPKQARGSLLSFGEVCQGVAEFYDEHAEDIDQQGALVKKAFAELNIKSVSGDQHLDYSPLDIARAQLQSSYDKAYGGFGAAPKFPQTTRLRLLLRHWSVTQKNGTPDSAAESILLLTLKSMSEGGLCDQLSGGFYRYSTDAKWDIPHFEKMLYDNGLLLGLYSEAAFAFNDDCFRKTALATASWALATMRSSEAGFYSAIDADSLGEEGQHYLWAPSEVRSLLDERAYELFALRYGLDQAANFDGCWHLRVSQSLGDIAKQQGLTAADVENSIDQSREILLLRRAERESPEIDDKQLTSWNALLIKGLADAGRYLDQPCLVQGAHDAIDFIREKLWDGEQLKSAYTRGQCLQYAFLDDYAFLIDALLSSLQARWRRVDLDFAIALADSLLNQFNDNHEGGFYFTAHDHEQLVHRPKDYADEAIPSGNAIAVYALTRLGHLVGDTRYIDAALETITNAWLEIQRMPSAYSSLLIALDEVLATTEIVVLRVADDTVDQWAAGFDYAPRQFRVVIASSENDLPGRLNNLTAISEFTAYRCHRGICEQPITDPARLYTRAC